MDCPKLLRSPDARVARHSQLRDPHVAPLTKFVTLLRREIGPHAQIPDFDPWDGGIDAELLYLLEAPGAKAVSSGFISRNNPDETARNFFELNEAARIPRKLTITWNIVPWYIGTDTRIRAARRSDIRDGIPPLTSLLDLLPRLRTIVLLGRKAETAGNVVSGLRPDLRVLSAPHPSPLFINNAPGNRARILKVLQEARSTLK